MRPLTPFLLLAVCTACHRVPAGATPRPHTCSIDGLPDDVQCATLSVWENRETRAGRRIPLNIVVVPALALPREPDPLFVLAGGPGQAATSLIQPFFRNRELRLHRDIVFVDQRGTGGSNPLNCALYGNPPDPKRVVAGSFPVDGVRACRQRLEKVADLAQYTTASAMDDVDEVRAWLGYERVNLWGGSYGTRAAQVYLRRHPERVRAVILDGVLPVEEIVPLHQAIEGQRALDRALTPVGAAEFQTLMRNVRQGIEVKVDGVMLRPTPLAIGEGIRHTLYSDTRGAVARLIHEAATGNPAPLVERAIRAEIGMEQLATGLNLSVTCTEDIPFLDDATVARETAGTFLGDLRIQRQREACREWVRGVAPPDVHQPVRSDIPVLLFSGELDPVTPPSFAERVAAGFPNHAHVVFSGSAHGSFGACARQLMAEFIAKASPRTLNTACALQP